MLFVITLYVNWYFSIPLCAFYFKDYFLGHRLVKNQDGCLQERNVSVTFIRRTEESSDQRQNLKTLDGVKKKELDKTWSTTLQSMMNAKLSKHRFWHCHENGLIKTIQTIPHNPYVRFKLYSFYCGIGQNQVFPSLQSVKGSWLEIHMSSWANSWFQCQDICWLS